MRSAMIFLLGLAAGAGVILVPAALHHLHEHWLAAHEGGGLAPGELMHTEERFEFTANGPIASVAPLFGAAKERVWARNWNPNFVWPSDETDREGMVFTVAHGHMKSVWVNTAFDLQGGNLQYVFVVPGAMTTRITVHLEPEREKTSVQVQYERTALDAGLNEHVKEMAEEDAKSGPHWEKEVNDYLAGQK